MKALRRHIDAILYALRVARMAYRNELRQDSLPF